MAEPAERGAASRARAPRHPVVEACAGAGVTEQGGAWREPPRETQYSVPLREGAVGSTASLGSLPHSCSLG